MSGTRGPEACVPELDGSCSICADEGLVGEVVSVHPGRVRLARGIEEVAFDLLDDVRPGERVVVHLGFAIARVRER